MDNKNSNLPNKVYRKPKNNYPNKRDNYRNYRNAKWNWQQIFDDIEKLRINKEKGYIKKISNKYNIKYYTLKEKYRNWIRNNKSKTNVVKENRGGHNKLFSQDEERSLFEYIKEVYIDTCSFFDDECLKLLAIKKWNTLYPDQKDVFKASNGWIYDFKCKWRLSSFISRDSKKSTLLNDNDLKIFLETCKEIGKTIGKSFIFNMDETFWRIINGTFSTIGITGSENRKVITNVNNKNGFTAVFIISADGKFLKPIIIIKGKTNRCLKKTELENDDLIFRKFTASGWIDINIMKFVLHEIHNITNGEKSALILDEFPVHTDENIKKKAAELNIKLIYVPSGRTATNQPLDVSINGTIKSIGKKIIKEVFIADPFAIPTLSDSIKSLIKSKNNINEDTIKKSFLIACKI